MSAGGAGGEPPQDGQAAAEHRLMRLAFGSSMGIRTKLLLLTLIPLVPLVLLDAVGLFSLERRHARDLGHRLDRVEELWRERLTELTREAAQTADALASSKRIEQALRRNHWAQGHEAAVQAVLAERDLRALLVDADGRTLADTASERFDVPVGELPLVARALAGEAVEGIERLDGRVFWGAARPVRVVGGLEGVVWVGFALGRETLAAFSEATSTELVLVDPLSGVATTTLAETPPLPQPPAPFATRTEHGERRFTLRPVMLSLPGSERPILTYVGIDHTALAEAVRNQLVTLGSVLGVLLVAILLATLTISNRVAVALRHVVEKMRLLRMGEYQKISPVVGRDEIAYLGRGYNEMIDGLVERDFVRETFGRYMSSEVARAVLDHPEGLRLGGEERTVTIMMCDLRGFTAFSAGHRPEEVVRVLNVWLQAMSDVIVGLDGTINEFLGDAILALFGAPESAPDDALRAARCAIAMQRALDGFNAENAETPEDAGVPRIPRLAMGIGLNSGTVIAGNIGSQKRAKYGVVGEAVNLAARVESFTVGSQVLLSENTCALIRADVEVGPPVEVQVKGSAKPIALYELRAVGDLRMPVPPPTGAAPADAPAQVWRIDGKEVAAVAEEARVVGVGEQTLWLALEPAPARHDNLKLRVDTAAGTDAEPRMTADLYAKVVGVPDPAGAVELHLTSASEADLRALADMVR